VNSLFDESSKAKGHGMFFSIFGINGVWAFALMLLLLDVAGITRERVLIVFASIGVAANISFFAVRPWPPFRKTPAAGATPEPVASAPLTAGTASTADATTAGATTADAAPIAAPPAAPTTGVVGAALEAFGMFKYPETWMLLPTAAFCGTIEGFFWGAVAQRLDASLLAACFLCFGVVSIVSSITMGWIADRVGKFPVLLGLMTAALVFNTLTGIGMEMPPAVSTGNATNNTAIVANTTSVVAAGNYSVQSMAVSALRLAGEQEQQRLTTRSALLIAGHAGFGLTDLPAQSLLRAAYSVAHSHRPNGESILNAAFANMLMKLIFCTTAAYLYGPHFSVWVQVGILHFFAVAAVVGQMLLRCRIRQQGGGGGGGGGGEGWNREGEGEGEGVGDVGQGGKLASRIENEVDTGGEAVAEDTAMIVASTVAAAELA
jgi:hypothetical protein